MSSELSDATEGVVKGLLDWSEEKIKSWVEKFKNKELLFVEDEVNISLVKKQRESSEYDLIKRYVHDKDIRLCCLLGLGLRDIEKKRMDFNPLKKKIVSKFGQRGLYIAHFVQNGLFSRYIGMLVSNEVTPEATTMEINDFLKDIEINVIYIQATDNVENRIREIITKIDSRSPRTFVLSSSGSAKEVCLKIYLHVKDRVDTYSSEKYEAMDKLAVFLYRQEYT